MIQRLDVDQRQRLLQRLGEHLVRPARLRDARRMVVRKDDAGRIVSQRRFDLLPAALIVVVVIVLLTVMSDGPPRGGTSAKKPKKSTVE